LAPQEGDFKRRSELEASAYLRDDHLEIECVLTVLKNAKVSETKSSPSIEFPPSDITMHLGKLLEAEKGADVILSVGGETFAAHKVILAMRSPVFRAEIYGPMSDE
jgi:speckle-type POZ protein